MKQRNIAAPFQKPTTNNADTAPAASINVAALADSFVSFRNFQFAPLEKLHELQFSKVTIVDLVNNVRCIRQFALSLMYNFIYLLMKLKLFCFLFFI
jgi:hypothetical protein